MRRRAVIGAALTAGLGAAVVLSGCTAAEAPAATQGTATSAGATVPVRALLDALPVRAETRGVRFDRDRFDYGGDLDPDGDGCWTRREVLIRDSIVAPRIGRSCAVTGEWRSAFDGMTSRDPDAFTIDHTVPLLEAWRSGADEWPEQRLVAYGNDLGYRGSLRAVTAALNEEKGNADPATWLPPQDRCAYVAVWVAVKTRWGLAVDADERDAIERVLDGCDDPSIARPPVPDLDALT